jgi:hypothetical protein
MTRPPLFLYIGCIYNSVALQVIPSLRRCSSMANRIRAPFEMLKCAERLSIWVYMLGLNNTLNTFSRGSRDFIACGDASDVLIVRSLLGWVIRGACPSHYSARRTLGLCSFSADSLLQLASHQSHCELRHSAIRKGSFRKC